MIGASVFWLPRLVWNFKPRLRPDVSRLGDNDTRCAPAFPRLPSRNALHTLLFHTLAICSGANYPAMFPICIIHLPVKVLPKAKVTLKGFA
jgi:hypothetical protein